MKVTNFFKNLTASFYSHKGISSKQHKHDCSNANICRYPASHKDGVSNSKSDRPNGSYSRPFKSETLDSELFTASIQHTGV